jgi:hypothetical protein
MSAPPYERPDLRVAEQTRVLLAFTSSLSPSMRSRARFRT